MKKFICLLALVFSICTACHKKENHTAQQGEIIYKPSYSIGFDIKENEHSGTHIINVYNPWQKSENISVPFYIYRDDELSSTDTKTALRGYAKRIICMSSTHIAMLDALGETDKIVGVSGKQYVSNEIVKNNPTIADVGYEGNIDYEAIVSVKPDLILLFSINGASSMEPKLKELGIPYLYIGDYVEENPLGKAEWIVAVAEVLGIREKGEEIFGEISDRYESLKNKIASIKEDKPKVMVNGLFLDSWFMPSSKSYVAKMIEDAGGDYIYKKNTGNSSVPIEMEEALELASRADFWINIGSVENLNEFKTTFPNFLNTNVVKNNRLYNNNLKRTPGGGNDCYESGVVFPDLVLRDMVKIFHPELAEEDFTYYHQLQ